MSSLPDPSVTGRDAPASPIRTPQADPYACADCGQVAGPNVQPCPSCGGVVRIDRCPICRVSPCYCDTIVDERDEDICGETFDHDTVTTHEDEYGYQWECRRCGAEGWEEAHQSGIAREVPMIGDVEREFLAASVAVWREIDRLEAEGDYPGIDEATDLRKRERAAWEAYRDALSAAAENIGDAGAHDVTSDEVGP